MHTHAEPHHRLWSLLLIRGVAGGACGLLVMANPAMSIEALGGIFAAYLAVSGITSLLAANYAKKSGTPGAGLVGIGILDLATAVAAVVWPAALALRLVAGLRAVAVGAVDAAWSYRLRVSEMVTLGGVALVLCGGLFLAWPGPGVDALPWLVGLSATVSGALGFAGAASELLHPHAMTTTTAVTDQSASVALP